VSISLTCSSVAAMAGVLLYEVVPNKAEELLVVLSF
jgi:hypothetical protein